MTPDKAHLTDIPKAIALFDDARRIMAASGNTDQWPPGYPAFGDITEDILQDRAYVLRSGSDIAGIVSVALGPFPLYEHAPKAHWLHQDPYASIHRVCTNASLGQKGIGRRLLQLAEAIALAHGYSNVRIHTHTKNLPMKKLLAKAGYQACGLIPGRDGYDRPAYQKNLSLVDPELIPHLSDAFSLAANPRGHAFTPQNHIGRGA